MPTRIFATYGSKFGLVAGLVGLWSVKVTRVKRGPSGKKRIKMYLNLKKRAPSDLANYNPASSVTCTSLADLQSRLKPRDNWSVVLDTVDRFCLIRLENREFNRSRLATKLLVEKGPDGAIKCKVQAHGCVVDMCDLKLADNLHLNSASIVAEVENVIDFVDSAQ